MQRGWLEIFKFDGNTLIGMGLTEKGLISQMAKNVTEIVQKTKLVERIRETGFIEVDLMAIGLIEMKKRKQRDSLVHREQSDTRSQVLRCPIEAQSTAIDHAAHSASCISVRLKWIGFV